MLKKIILLLGILLFSNIAFALNDVQKLYMNAAREMFSELKGKELTAQQFQKAIEQSNGFAIGMYIHEVGKNCRKEINKRIEKGRKISGKDYFSMLDNCNTIGRSGGSIDSWREEWVNYDYANHKATPRELLANLYISYTNIKLCYLVREDYKVQYITYGEFEGIKKRISEFEKSIQDSLIDISLEDLWNSTMVKVNGAQIIADAKKNTEYNELGDITCQDYKENFYTLINENSKPTKLEKDF